MLYVRLPVGLEDVSKYPNLIAELLSRGWEEADIAGLTSGNIIRVMGEVERVRDNLKPDEPHQRWINPDELTADEKICRTKG